MIELTTCENGIQIGDKISIDEFDKNIWKRFWCFITFRKRPLKREYYIVTNFVTSSLELEEL